MAVGYYILMFILGLALLVWGSNLFVDSAITLANHFHLSEVLIGATIVSLGTTLPETLFSTIASVQGLPEMALGNALGSILCNTGLIAGMMMILKPVVLKQQELANIKAGIFFLSAGFFVYAVSGGTAGGLTRISGALLLVILAVFIANTVQNTSRRKLEASQKLKEPKRPELLQPKKGSQRPELLQPKKGSQQPELPRQGAGAQSFGTSDVIRIFLEAGAIYIGADILVKYGPRLARELGIPEMVISLTFVALGTSLPELVTSLVALKKEHSALSLGNIIGANILNFILVGGISSLICPIPYPEHIMRLELPFIFFLLFLLCIPSILFKKAGRVQGIFMMGGYLLYLVLM